MLYIYMQKKSVYANIIDKNERVNLSNCFFFILIITIKKETKKL